MKIINRTVWILSLVSLFADVASEMLYPVVPIYLKEIGFSVLLIGVLEGIAEFTAGLSKGYFGKRSDEKGIRLPFIKAGYFLSALSKPMMAVLTYPWWIFLARTTDRLGKGLRTAARDALLSQNATPQTKARVFAFHRGMDTLGAVIGPVLALTFLYFFPRQYAPLFYYAFIPGMVAVGLIFLLKEKKQPSSTLRKGNFFSFFRYWSIAPVDYKQLVLGLLVFTLFNSSDVFLLLKTKEITGSDTTTILAYIFYNLVYAVASYPLGVLADRFGLKRVFCGGLLVFAIVYLLFALSTTTYLLFIAFFLYGIYAAATEGIAKAWITNLAHDTNTATAIGFYTSGQSICTLLASVVAGVLWTGLNSTVPFIVTALAALGVYIYFRLIPAKNY
ncbi:MFS transporter [Flavisolibacter tropicus]|uniref:ABC transporter permease n=1 Tax=Flavisolibacter tropicus TaxID=1492898 RepID=A0A172U2W2_9BACT|nr:MFS transporter [Flavisolibacter tropicus]ANE53572.1 ABC transporter permease [Flavisolibacter tropicus]